MSNIASLEQDEQNAIKNYRALPYNTIAEQVLLGAILTNNEMMYKINDFLTADHFYEPVHKRIYEAINIFMDRGTIATPIILKNYFDKDETLKDIGGASYLARLAGLSTTIINIVDYARTIYNLSIRRKLILLGEDIVNNAYDNEIVITASEQIELAEQELFNLASEGKESNTGFSMLRNPLAGAVNRMQLAFKHQERITGISSGLLDLDKLLNGFQDSDLLILAGRPSMGKTALAVNLALNACNFLVNSYNEKKQQNKEEIGENNHPPSVGFFSLEMSSEQLASRMLSMVSEINAAQLRSGQINETDFNQILLASKELHQLPFFIDDTPAITISALRTRARRLKRRHNLSILFVDYLQLIRGVSKNSAANRVLEVSEITQGLKAIAKELNIPVIALSQLSRAVEQREDKKPLLSDLRESGSIEQDADIVMFIYRDEYYIKRKEPQESTEEHIKWQAEMERVMNVAEVIVAKQRNGPTGNVKMFFNANTTKFSNLLSKEQD